MRAGRLGLQKPEQRDQATEAARLKGAAREAEDADLVARLIGLDEEPVAGLDALGDAVADGPDGKRPPTEVLVGGNADLVVCDLCDAVSALPGHGAIQLHDVGSLVLVVGPVPGAVEKAQKSLHQAAPRFDFRTAFARSCDRRACR